MQRCKDNAPANVRRPINTSGEYAQGSFDLLPLAGERAKGALYFTHRLGVESLDQDKLIVARRYLRASLSEFRSIFNMLGADFKSLGVATQWDHSSQSAEMEADPLVAVLRKVRDFAIHSNNVAGMPRTFKVGYVDETSHRVDNMNAIVIEPLDRAALARSGRKRELSEITDEALAEFNDLAQKIPADILIQVTVHRTSEYLAEFLKANHTAIEAKYAEE